MALWGGQGMCAAQEVQGEMQRGSRGAGRGAATKMPCAWVSVSTKGRGTGGAGELCQVHTPAYGSREEPPTSILGWPWGRTAVLAPRGSSRSQGAAGPATRC